MKVYKPQEFSKMLGVSISTLQRWDRDGVFVAHRTPTGRRFYTQEDYEKFMNGTEISTTE